MKNPPPEPAAAQRNFEIIEREIRRQRIFNLIAGLLVFILASALTTTFVVNYLSGSKKTVPTGKKISYVASRALSADEQWVQEYQQIAFKATGNEPSGPKPLSTVWVINAAYHIIMGEQALRLNDLAVAQYHLEKAHEIFPDMTGIQRDLGTVYLKQQSFTQAAPLLQQAQEQHPSIEVLNNLGVACMELSEYDRAEALFRQALQLQPDLASCYRNLAFLYQKTGRTDEAVVAFEKYFLLNPEDSALLEKYMNYLTEADRVLHATDFLERLKGADPLAVDLLLAKAAARDNDAECAVRALRKAARFLTPRQTIAEMHDDAFKPISRTEPFETLIYQLELAAVSLSTNLVETMPSP